MGKSSSSIKKKRSRVSSVARTRKRSKSKTRRSNKFKKLRRRDDSVSYSSDSDDSRSLVSVSSSSSDDGVRSKRSRSRMRKDVKSKSKRARRRSSSGESAEESRPVKKRKGSKKTDDLQVGKKTDKRKKKKKTKQKKKKSKREMSVSSASRSYSTCHGGSGSSSENEVEKNRSRFDRKESKDRSRLEEVKSGSKRRRSRSRSRSVYSRCSESSGYRSEEELTGEVKPWRLKSVITVLREGREDGGMYEDEHKEEIVYDYDDCPPCRSNDSNDGVSKRDLVNNNSHVASETKRYAEDEKREEPLISNMRTGNVLEIDKESEGQYDRSSPGRYGIGMNNAVEETNNEDTGGVDSPRSHDLESILRQKALENLRSFRKVTQLDAKAPPVNQKDTNECDAKTPIATKAEFYEHKSPKGGDPIGGSLAEKNTTPAVKKGPTFAHKKISGMNDDNKGSLSSKDNAVHPPNQAALASNPNENVSATVRSVSSKPRWVSLSSRKESLNTYTNKKHVVELQDPPQAKSVTSNSVVETARTTISLPGNSNGEEANNASASDDPSTCPKSISGGVNSNKPQDEATEDSQFQQKTMTVMRGGELVEVGVYVFIVIIPLSLNYIRCQYYCM
ncbi:hypothetical protein Dsin_022281 [Dipteronia sinensis]|uniref:Uncharacterized protein n=1 Tax=Dipteronia sinensis TaxID=43782 RepID=A0AAE0DZS8_9ROSI|nr:hypothetical protein Dsin_022281 [Dipteronia sinensis]